VLRWLRVAGGWERKDVERNLQERTETEADRLWTKFRASAGGVVDATLLVAHEDRDGSAYGTPTSGQNPLMRKYYLADRNRDEVEFRLGLVPADTVNIGMTSRYAENRYKDAAIGLQETSNLAWTFDGSVAFGNGNSVYAAYTRETVGADLANSQNFGDPNWSGHSDDEFDTFVAGLDMPRLTDRLGLNVDFTYADSTGENVVAIDNTTQDGPFPNLATELTSLRVTLDYQWRESTTIRVGYWYENYDASDWSLQGVDPATVPNLLSLGADPFDYDVNTVMVSIVYRAN
jgi:MtrB/PioB family decaheme-associated outer membrane protein